MLYTVLNFCDMSLSEMLYNIQTIKYNLLLFIALCDLILVHLLPDISALT